MPDFNPRARMGARLKVHGSFVGVLHFNPRARMGARRFPRRRIAALA